MKKPLRDMSLWEIWWRFMLVAIVGGICGIVSIMILVPGAGRPFSPAFRGRVLLTMGVASAIITTLGAVLARLLSRE